MKQCECREAISHFLEDEEASKSAAICAAWVLWLGVLRGFKSNKFIWGEAGAKIRQA